MSGSRKLLCSNSMSKRTLLCIALGIVLSSSSLASDRLKLHANRQALSPLAIVESAYQSGKISEGERLTLKLQYLLDQPSFPAAYAVEGVHGAPLKCGTDIVLEVKKRWSELTNDQQALAAGFFARPATDTHYVSPGGFFKIHYDSSGFHGVSMADDDANSIPDFIDLAAKSFDSSWNYYHNTLGFLLPPSDGAFGGDSLYDVYIRFVGAYGITFAESPGPEPWNDYTSYILVHNNFETGFPPNDDPDGTAAGALKVTCAHEYFHAAQLAYDRDDDLWMYESGATWEEEEIFPLVNDNHQFLPFYYDEPDTFLTTSTGNFMYGGLVWPQFLTEKFGTAIMRDVWEAARFVDGVDALDSALALYGSVTSKEYSDFVTWNFFSGNRFRPGYFSTGAEYPGIIYDHTLPASIFSSVTPQDPPDGLGANYIIWPTPPTPKGLLKLDFDGSDVVLWRVNIYLKDSAGNYLLEELSTDILGKGQYIKYDYNKWDTIFIVPHVISQWQNNNSYDFSTTVVPYGDADGSGDLNVGDAIYLIRYIFTDGPEPVHDIRMGDADCGGNINIGDALAIVKYIFDGQELPCFE